MRKNRVNVTFSPVHDREEEIEELRHIRSQRELFKNYKSSVPFSSIAQSDNNDEDILRIQSEPFVDPEIDCVFECEDHNIIIEDFDFVERMITVYVGDTVSFSLSPSVPLHAEHIIYGTSENSLLNFESDVLQISDCSRFSVKTSSTGEIRVSCKIYHEMNCIIDVKPNTRRMKPLSMDESGITAVALISETSMDSHTHSAHSISSESFYDSDDVLSDVDYEQGEENNADDDEDDEIDAHHLISIGDQLIKDPFSEDPHDLGDLYLTDILDAANLEDFVILVDEYSFRPDRVECAKHAVVKFVLDDACSSFTISCDGEFNEVSLNRFQKTYRHQFQRAGILEVYNNRFNFVCCRVEVHSDDADSPTQMHLHNKPTSLPSALPSAIFDSNQLRLFGSFLPAKLPLSSDVSQTSSSILNPLAVCPSSAQSIELPSVSLGHDLHLNEVTYLSHNEEECLQVLQDCLEYDKMENLSRAAKKRLKYKQRTRNKKLNSYQACESSDSNEQPIQGVSVQNKPHPASDPSVTTTSSSIPASTCRKKRRKSLSNPSKCDKTVAVETKTEATIVENSAEMIIKEFVSFEKRNEDADPNSTSPKKIGDSGIVSSPLQNSRYAFAVADWTEDLEILSDSDDSSMPASESIVSESFVNNTKACEQEVIVKAGFDETKAQEPEGDLRCTSNMLNEDIVVILETITEPTIPSDEVNTKHFELTNSNTADIAIEQDNDSETLSTDSDNGSLGLIEIEDERWLLTDDEDDTDINEILDSRAVEAEHSTISDNCTQQNESCLTIESAVSASVSSSVLSKRGLLLSVLGLPPSTVVEPSEIAIAETVFATAENNIPDINITKDQQTLEQSPELVAWERRLKEQQEFVDLFIQRTRVANERANAGVQDKWPSGKAVGIFHWDELPLRNAIAPTAVLPAKSTADHPDVVAVAVETMIKAVRNAESSTENAASEGVDKKDTTTTGKKSSASKKLSSSGKRNQCLESILPAVGEREEKSHSTSSPRANTLPIAPTLSTLPVPNHLKQTISESDHAQVSTKEIVCVDEAVIHTSSRARRRLSGKKSHTKSDVSNHSSTSSLPLPLPLDLHDSIPAVSATGVAPKPASVLPSGITKSLRRPTCITVTTTVGATTMASMTTTSSVTTTTTTMATSSTLVTSIIANASPGVDSGAVAATETIQSDPRLKTNLRKRGERNRSTKSVRK
jgi:hypothetical protein